MGRPNHKRDTPTIRATKEIPIHMIHSHHLRPSNRRAAKVPRMVRGRWRRENSSFTSGTLGPRVLQLESVVYESKFLGSCSRRLLPRERLETTDECAERAETADTASSMMGSRLLRELSSTW